ncbi:type II toxin-antitoxin system Phd/YefM family antitoxin [Desulfatiglans anilini]|uniref:type II toxin-antitoxin system Phd/YefM family antitoxin n=1 Tax=Desulfatiglans anilini TaxID=90728 RepID=UPI000424BCD4|nr:type II toxin-antitoxin system Phd/YefM family antitoxin [Desulfatiglans anilini]
MKSNPVLKLIDTLSARTRFGELLDKIEKENAHFLISKRGKPRAVILSAEDYLKNIGKGSKIKNATLEIPLKDFLQGKNRKKS